MFDPDFEVWRRQKPARLLRPFDQNDGFFLEDVPETRIQPFSRIAKSIKIKMIEV